VGEDTVSTELDGEHVLLNVSSGLYFGLSQVASCVWKNLSTSKTTAELCDLVQAEYDVSAERCLADVESLLCALLDKGLIRDLFTCHRHLIVTGATGTGKTWICCALGNQAAREGFSVLYARLSRLLDDLATARLANAVGRLMRRLAKVDLLILDDWAMTDLTAQQRRDLMEIVDDRHDRRSIILATQVPVDRWHDMIGDPTYADAILDRIVHNATRVELKGESLRKTRADAMAAAN
jgi:hypothetical protein